MQNQQQPNQYSTKHASPDQPTKAQNSGNFKDNPEKAREAGRKGGEHSHGTQRSDDE